MKKLAIALTIILINCGVSFGQNYINIDDMNNQNVDRFFTTSSNNNKFRSTDDNNGWGLMPSLIGHGLDYDYDAAPAPLGSGLLLLTGMGIAYGIRRKK
ncbi:MAG: hypothetical protein IKU01_05355 [Bacteroidales bacterium]|nr:hypothetical protein [Bacteroidales bacterium]